jgi:acetylglutamate kinase
MKRLVVKIGGASLETPELRRRCARAVAELAADGHQIVVVHGGGAALTRTLGRLGKESRFIDGLRVTDAETRDVALMVLAGAVNKALVADLAMIGQPAMGLCGGDGFTFRARKKQYSDDLGFVGEVSAVDIRWFSAIWEVGGVPVVSSLALGTDGQYYNVNADQMASACAVACSADALIFLTDVPGVKDSDGAVIRWLRVEDIAAMAGNKVIGGGMLPKLEACREALRQGVRRVRILPAAEAGRLAEFYLARIDSGTEVVAA